MAQVLRLVLPLALVSCSFDTSNLAHPGNQHDGSVDATPRLSDAAVDAKVCDSTFDFTLLNIDTCDLPPEAGALFLDEGPFLLNTKHGTLQSEEDTITIPFKVIPQEDGPDLFVARVQSLQIGFDASLYVVGPRPLLLVSMSDISIDGELYARGDRNTSGAGGDQDEDCLGLGRGTNGVIQTDSNANSAGSGGGGGGFGVRGGDGAKIYAAVGGVDSAGGSPAAGTTLTPLRAGCAGGAGGGAGGAGGGAGGAIQIVAVDTFTLSGRVSVSGGGGQGTTARHSGGGGGGSGGGILIQARSLMGTGQITANGGGGGEGSRTTSMSTPGTDGGSGPLPASGGSSGSSGGDGGDGGVVVRQDGAVLATAAIAGLPGSNNMSNAVGSGGGGGGAGQIRIVLH